MRKISSLSRVNIKLILLPALLAALLSVPLFSGSAYAQDLEVEQLENQGGLESQSQQGAEIQNQQATEEATMSASPSPTQSDGAITTVETREISGEVIQTSEDSITIEEDDGTTTQVPLSSNIRITRDGNEAAITDIQTGDTATATIDSSTQEVITLEATSNQFADMEQWLIPAIIGGLILLGLIYWLIRKSNQRHIKTSTNQF